MNATKAPIVSHTATAKACGTALCLTCGTICANAQGLGVHVRTTHGAGTGKRASSYNVAVTDSHIVVTIAVPLLARDGGV